MKKVTSKHRGRPTEIDNYQSMLRILLPPIFHWVLLRNQDDIFLKTLKQTDEIKAHELECIKKPKSSHEPGIIKEASRFNLIPWFTLSLGHNLALDGLQCSPS